MSCSGRMRVMMMMVMVVVLLLRYDCTKKISCYWNTFIITVCGHNIEMHLKIKFQNAFNIREIFSRENCSIPVDAIACSYGYEYICCWMFFFRYRRYFNRIKKSRMQTPHQLEARLNCFQGWLYNYHGEMLFKMECCEAKTRQMCKLMQSVNSEIEFCRNNAFSIKVLVNRSVKVFRTLFFQFHFFVLTFTLKMLVKLIIINLKWRDFC